MTPTHALATKLAGDLFDRIERDKTLLRSTFEEVICDGLLLDGAKTKSAPASGPSPQGIIEEAKKIIKILHDDPPLAMATPRKLLIGIEHLYNELKKTGWQP